MSFKNFSTTHNAPTKNKPAENAKAAPMVDQPPAPTKAPVAAKPADKA